MVFFLVVFRLCWNLDGVFDIKNNKNVNNHLEFSLKILHGNKELQIISFYHKVKAFG